VEVNIDALHESICCEKKRLHAERSSHWKYLERLKEEGEGPSEQVFRLFLLERSLPGKVHPSGEEASLGFQRLGFVGDS